MRIYKIKETVNIVVSTKFRTVIVFFKRAVFLKFPCRLAKLSYNFKHKPKAIFQRQWPLIACYHNFPVKLITSTLQTEITLVLYDSGVFCTKNITKEKSAKFIKIFELDQVLVHNFLSQNVLVPPKSYTTNAF